MLIYVLDIWTRRESLQCVVEEEAKEQKKQQSMSYRIRSILLGPARLQPDLHESLMQVKKPPNLSAGRELRKNSSADGPQGNVFINQLISRYWSQGCEHSTKQLKNNLVRSHGGSLDPSLASQG